MPSSRMPASSTRARSTARMAPAVSIWGSTQANSSPPIRATSSPARHVAVSSRPASSSTASPAWCPNVSLIVLKSSRSMIASVSMWPWRRARSTSPFRRAVNARRFARPVSGSVATSRSSSARVSAFDTAIVASSANAASRRSSAALNADGRAEPAARAPHRWPRVHSGAEMPLRRPASRTSEIESSGATIP
jgi:hypothetical protein